MVLILVLGLLGYANVAIVRSFRRAGRRWWTALAVAWMAGIGAGVWGTFCFDYWLSPRDHVYGAPILVAVLRWEGPPRHEQWVDYVTPAPFLVAGANALILGLLAACPVGLAFRAAGFLSRRGAAKMGTGGEALTEDAL
jgi:hypothetical protein